MRKEASRMICRAAIVLAALAGASASLASPAPLADDDFVTLSGPASPRVALALRQEADKLTLVLDIGAFSADGSGTSVALGLAAAKSVVLGDKDAQVALRDGVARYTFTVPASALVAADADWSRLRLGVVVVWKGGALGQDRQRERFRHLDAAPPHAGLGARPEAWVPFDLKEYAALVADRKRRILIDFSQPMDGKATVVIEDAGGNRIRNLVSGAPMAKGRTRIEWDGLDEEGRVVKPGHYTWRAISHPGIVPEYLFSFCNDGKPPWRTGSGTDMWGPDHSCLVAAAAGSEWTFFGGPCAESGYAIVAVDAEGTKRMQYNPPMGTGIEKVALATDGEFLFAAHDGFAWGQHVDRQKPGWKAVQKLTLTRFDVKSGKVVDFPGGQRFAVVATLEVGPGSLNPKFEGHNLASLAALGGKLYVSSRAAGAILVVDAKTGKPEGEVKLDAPGALVATKDAILAVSGSKIVRIVPQTAGGQETNGFRLPTPSSPQGIAVDASGNLYVSDGATHTVRVFDAAGKPLRKIGKAGGPYAGKYDPEVLVNPRGIAVAPNGVLWVTEDRWNPKRTVAWDTKTGKAVREKFGPTSYGASGGGFDSADVSRWIGQGALWSLDFAKKSAACTGVLEHEPGHVGGYLRSQLHYKFVHQGGRTFVIGLGSVTTFSELKADGSLRDLAFVGSTHRFSFACDWNPPAAFVEAFEKAYPGKKGKHGDKGPGVLWVDRSGDGLCQADEFDFSTECENFAGAYWGQDFADLTLRIPATVKGRRVLVALEPDGFLPSGAPKYPPLNEACAKAVAVDLATNEVESSVDRFGNVVVNSDPEMKALAPDGRTLWTYPNRWTNVHGSHGAPLPETGVMQGTLFFLGMAPLDAKADVFIVNGNHGRFFALTSDGLYLDEMFKDVRMGTAVDATLIGGECFGGFFAKAEKDGAYYLQSGHTDYRIFRVNGLDKVQRQQGTIEVTPEQALAADSGLRRKAAETVVAKEATLPYRAKPPVGGKDDPWAGVPEIRWEKNGRFPASVRAAWDETNLHLCYTVRDDSRWVNGGKDWTLLFKTGDSVDFQIGTDPSSDPARKGAAPGDVRLLIAPFEDGSIAVLYRYRVPGAKSPVAFTSPWRSETVDEVRRLDEAKVAVQKREGEYRVEAVVPLASLGLRDVRGKTFKADFGVIYGDPGGAINMLRSYWSNPATGLVNDVPGEIMLAPNLWGRVTFGGEK